MVSTKWRGRSASCSSRFACAGRNDTCASSLSPGDALLPVPNLPSMKFWTDGWTRIDRRFGASGRARNSDAACAGREMLRGAKPVPNDPTPGPATRPVPPCGHPVRHVRSGSVGAVCCACRRGEASPHSVSNGRSYHILMLSRESDTIYGDPGCGNVETT